MVRSDALAPRFTRAWRGVGARPAPPALLGELLAAWDSPGRVYHGTPHLLDGLRRLDPLRSTMARPNEVELGWWFHDALLAPGASDNEARSAAWAAQALHDAGAPTEAIVRIEAMILATRHRAEPPSPDAAVLVDVDLAVLAGDPADYDAYAEGVRAEYGFLSDAMWAAGRGAFLEELLGKPRIFHTDTFRDALEATARANLRRELARLG